MIKRAVEERRKNKVSGDRSEGFISSSEKGSICLEEDVQDAC